MFAEKRRSIGCDPDCALVTKIKRVFGGINGPDVEFIHTCSTQLLQKFRRDDVAVGLCSQTVGLRLLQTLHNFRECRMPDAGDFVLLVAGQPVHSDIGDLCPAGGTGGFVEGNDQQATAVGLQSDSDREIRRSGSLPLSIRSR